MTAPDVLVGHSGLVGGNLLAARQFDLLVRSVNRDDLRGGRFGHVVFSAARAEKWRANADPAADARHIDELIDLAGAFTADRVTLVSTVDVFAAPAGADETFAVPTDGLHPYGLGRRRLEEAVVGLHPDVLVLRLPGLFGAGLKKNVVFDLLHGNEVQRIQPGSSFQYYDLCRLGDDVDAAWAAGLGLAHLVTEPVRTADVVDRVFGLDPLPPNGAPVVRYDLRTVHADALGGSGPYLEDAGTVLSRMRDFVARERVR